MKSTLLEAHEPKQGGGGGGAGDWLQQDKVAKETTSPPTCFQNNLELRLGISLSNNNNKEYKDSVAVANTTTKAAALATNPNPSRLVTTLDGLVLNGLVPGPCPSGTTSTATTTITGRWFAAEPTCSVGFIHPWSLAARQQKAVFEQAHHRSMAAINPSSSSSTPAVPRFMPPAPPPIVGWPPVRASRRNLVSPSPSPSPSKPEMDGEKDAKKAKLTKGGESKSLAADHQVKPAATLFVKVNMEGFAVGRKINLKAHDSYDSLSRSLQKMFLNFLSTNYSNNSPQEEQVAGHNPDYILLYEDHEGDRMLVGDVPWELFITSVKRLYIAHSPKTPKKCDEKTTDD